MMISNFYSDDIVGNLASMFDLAVNDYNIDGDKFWDMFVTSGIAEQIENNNPKYTAGQSGEELLLEIIRRTGITAIKESKEYFFGRSAEYWCGYIIAKSRIALNKSFKEIHNLIAFEELENMYKTLHEAPAEKTIEIIEKRSMLNPTKLKLKRENLDMSQADLAEKSSVSKRTIQAYEQRDKEINKASVEIVSKLASALNCSIGDLLE
jgi:DNA-binding transcriptional regulator YiaG